MTSKFQELYENYVKIEDNKVARKHFEDYKDKMGPKEIKKVGVEQAIEQAIEWIKTLSLKKKDEEETTKQIVRYIKDPYWWGMTLGKLKKK